MTSLSPQWRRIYGVLAVLSCLLSACAGQDRSPGSRAADATTGGPRAAPLFPSTPPLQLVDLVYQGTEYTEASARLLLAERLRFLACMEDAGFAIDLARAPDPEPIEVGEPNLERRAAAGWGITEEPETDPLRLDQVDADGRTASEVGFGDEDEVMQIDSGMVGTARVGGCRGDALAAVYGSIERWTLVAHAPIRAHNSAAMLLPEAGRNVVLSRWKECMGGKGYEAENSGDLKAEFSRRVDAAASVDGALRREEVTLAVEDGQCILTSGVIELRRQAAEEYIASMDDSQRQELEDVLSGFNEASAKASLVASEAARDLGVG